MGYSISQEFDDLFNLLEQLGFKGEVLESNAAYILHVVNEAIRSEINARS